MSRFAGESQVAAGIVIDDDRQMDAVFKILLDRCDGGGFPCQGKVENISVAARAQADAVPGPKLYTRPKHCLQRLSLRR